jgi:AraC-like DNA-binding protein
MREEFIRIYGKAQDENLFKLHLAGTSYCDGTYSIKRNRKNIYVFEYIIKGEGYLYINGNKFYPQEGDAYIVHPYTNHVYGSSAENPWTKIWMNVSGALVKELMELYGLQNVFHISNCPLERIFTEAFTEMGENSTAHSIASIALHKIVMTVATVLKARSETKKSPAAVKLKNFLDKNMKTDITLEQMAECISKSPSQTIRIFKAEWGLPPYRYLLNNKIDYAQTLLGNTNMTVKEAAFELGFKDEYYFSNIFKARTGHRPSEIQKNNA